MSHGYNLRDRKPQQQQPASTPISIPAQPQAPVMATAADALDAVTAVGARIDAVETGQQQLENQLGNIAQQLATLVARGLNVPAIPSPPPLPTAQGQGFETKRYIA